MYMDGCGSCRQHLPLNLLPKAIPLNYQESWRTSVKSNVLNPFLFGQFVQLPASGKSVSSSFENGTDLRLRYTFCSIHACNLLAGTRLRSASHTHERRTRSRRSTKPIP